jgi:hypothetical protein
VPGVARLQRDALVPFELELLRNPAAWPVTPAELRQSVQAVLQQHGTRHGS